MWVSSQDLARSPGHSFYQRLKELLDEEKFDHFAEGLCRNFDAPRTGGLVWHRRITSAPY
jgi:hypothetical protein